MQNISKNRDDMEYIDREPLSRPEYDHPLIVPRRTEPTEMPRSRDELDRLPEPDEY